MEQKEQLKLIMREMLSEFTDEVLLPGVEKTVKEIIAHELENYPTKADLDEHKDEIIREIRKKMENVVQHQTVVTGVIERKGCAKPDELKILEESVS